MPVEAAVVDVHLGVWLRRVAGGAEVEGLAAIVEDQAANLDIGQ